VLWFELRHELSEWDIESESKIERERERERRKMNHKMTAVEN